MKIWQFIAIYLIDRLKYGNIYNKCRCKGIKINVNKVDIKYLT